MVKDEIKIYRLAQSINNYDEVKDGCVWGHILELVIKAYELGRKTTNKSKLDWEEQLRTFNA